jgi:hypothetical protein
MARGVITLVEGGTVQGEWTVGGSGVVGVRWWLWRKVGGVEKRFIGNGGLSIISAASKALIRTPKPANEGYPWISRKY